MSISIWLPIVLYAVLAIILAANILVGIKDGIIVSIIKTVLTAGSAVGAYFATPALFNWAVNSESVGEETKALIMAYEASIKSAVLFVIVIVAFLLVCGICAIIRHKLVYRKLKKHKATNGARERKVSGVDRKAERRAARKEARAFRAEKKSVKIAYKKGFRWYNRLIGSLCGIIIGCIISTAVFVPVNYIFKDIGNEKMISAYEITPFGYAEKELDFMKYIVGLNVEEGEEEVPEIENPEMEGPEGEIVEG